MSSYKKGYRVELLCKQQLLQKGAYVIRSAASKGLADLIAIYPEKGEIWLIQVKKMNAPKNIETLKKKFEELGKLAGNYKCRSFVFLKIKGKYDFVEVSEPQECEEKYVVGTTD